MLDQHNLVGAEHLLGDDEGAVGVTGGAAGVADDVGVAKAETEGLGGVDTGVHAGDWVVSVCCGVDVGMLVKML